MFGKDPPPPRKFTKAKSHQLIYGTLNLNNIFDSSFFNFVLNNYLLQLNSSQYSYRFRLFYILLKGIRILLYFCWPINLITIINIIIN